MRDTFVALACALSLSACITQDPTPQVTSEPAAPRRGLKPAAAIGEAKDRVMSSLKDDPESARFTEVSFKPSRPNGQGHPIDVVCGMVNAKSSGGVYGGPRPFAYLVDRRIVALSDGSGSTDSGMIAYRTLCDGNIASR